MLQNLRKEVSRVGQNSIKKFEYSQFYAFLCE